MISCSILVLYEVVLTNNERLPLTNLRYLRVCVTVWLIQSRLVEIVLRSLFYFEKLIWVDGCLFSSGGETSIANQCLLFGELK